MLIAHVQYVGAETMASQYAYAISLFDTESRATGHKFQGLVTSTLRPLESQCTKDADIFVTTFHQARSYTDGWGNLNFIIDMKKLSEDQPSGSGSAVTNKSTTSTSGGLVPAQASTSSSVSADTSSLSSSSSRATNNNNNTTTADTSVPMESS